MAYSYKNTQSTIQKIKDGDVKTISIALVGLYLFYKIIYPILKTFTGGLANVSTDLVSGIQGTTPEQRKIMNNDAYSVAKYLGTNADRDYWFSMDWMTEDEVAAYTILKKYKDNLNEFQTYYSKHTGGNSIVVDIEKYFTGTHAHLKRKLGL